MLFKNTVHENVLLFSRIYLYVHRIISNRNVPYFIRKICDLINCNPFQPTNQPLITSPALRWPIYRIHGGVCIKWHAITAVSAYIDIGSNFFYCLARHEEATMARVLISREMRLRSFDAATQSIRTYLWLYPVFFHAVSFVNYAYAYFTSLPFGVHSVCVRRRFYRLKKISSQRKIARARAVYRCPWQLRALATPNPPALPHAAASIVTSTLTPFSTGTGAHFITRSHPPRRFDRNFRPRERNNIEARTIRWIYSRARVRKKDFSR